METSILIAQIFGLVYLSISVGIIFSKKYYQKALASMLDNTGLMYLGGLMALVAGFFIVKEHNIWSNDWTVLVTIFGWLALIKGILLLAAPQFVDTFRSWYKPENINKFVFIPLIIGLVFAYFGFVA